MRAPILLLALGLLLAAPPAAATGAWKQGSPGDRACGSSTPTNVRDVGPNDVLCWTTTADDDSDNFFVSRLATVTMNADDAADSSAARGCTFRVRYCPAGPKPSSNPTYACLDITGSDLDGVEGAAGSNTAALPVLLGRGNYYIDITTSSGGDTCTVAIQGQPQ